MRFIFCSEFLESGSLALRMKEIEGQNVKVYISDKAHRKVLDGLLDKEDEFTQFQGQGNIFITDDASSGKLADSLRQKGELVFGGSEISDRLENERKFGQKVLKDSGLETVEYQNFIGVDSYDKALEFIKEKKGRWCFKQNGEESKSYNHVGKFDNSDDMVSHILDMKKIWTENIDFNLQKFIPGHECAIEGWFNGKEFLRDKQGEELFIINWEHKMKSNCDLGATTGEVGTLQYRANSDSSLIKELKKVEPYLTKIKYIGNVDLNFIISEEDGIPRPLEWTNRFGYPSLNMHEEAMITPWHEMIEKTVKGENDFMEYDPSWCVVICVTIPPFPFQTQNPDFNAKGQRVYFLNGNGEWDGKDHLTKEKLKHLHPYELRFDGETKYYVCTGDTGYLLTVTDMGETPEEANANCLARIEDYVLTANMDFRTDIGVNDRVSSSIEYMMENNFL